MKSAIKIFSILINYVLCTNILFAQKYNFVNYTVDDGLIQSQANSICRDKMGHLWVATMGGVSCYDGKNFKNYTTNNGLLSNIAYTITCDSQNNILICTDKGLSVFNGRVFHNFTFRYKDKDHRVSNILPVNSKEYLVLAGSRLFKVKNNKVEDFLINSDTTLQFTALASVESILFAATFKKGLYIFNNSDWHHIDYPKTKEDVFFVRKIEAGSYFITNAGVYQYQLNRQSGQFHFPESISRTDLPAEIQDRKDITSIARDDKNNLWFGTFKGAIVYNEKKRIALLQ